MKTVLIISSQVAASRVGASAGAFCLQRLGVNTVVLPTILLGRHPGWGEPGGGAVDPQRLADMWTRIKAQDLRFDAVLTGYMTSAEHVTLAEQIIADVKATNPEVIILVDPVMGDNGALYIKPDTARAIIERLAPLAQYITPNLWELGHMLQAPVETPKDILRAAQAVNATLICTSVQHDGKIGALLTAKTKGWLAAHTQFDRVPHGGGDAFAAIFLSHIIRGAPATEALARASASIFGILEWAHTKSHAELPIIEAQDQLLKARPLSLIEIAL